MEHAQQSQTWTLPPGSTQTSQSKPHLWQPDEHASFAASQASSKRGFGLPLSSSAGGNNVSEAAEHADSGAQAAATLGGDTARNNQGDLDRDAHDSLTDSLHDEIVPRATHMLPQLASRPASTSSGDGHGTSTIQNAAQPASELQSNSRQHQAEAADGLVSVSGAHDASGQLPSTPAHTKTPPWQSEATVHSNAVFTNGADTPDAVKQLHQQLRQVGTFVFLAC